MPTVLFSDNNSNYSNVSVVVLVICLEVVLSMELHLGAPLSHSTGKSEVHSSEVRIIHAVSLQKIKQKKLDR